MSDVLHRGRSWRATVILESSAHFWGFWQRRSRVELSLLSWSVTSYRQTWVPDGAPLVYETQADWCNACAVWSHAALATIKRFREWWKDTYVDMYFFFFLKRRGCSFNFQIMTAQTNRGCNHVDRSSPALSRMSLLLWSFCTFFFFLQRAFSKITVYFAKVAL